MLTLHFLNVGKGHCSIIDFPSGRLTLIDIDDSRSFTEEDLDDMAEMLGIKSSFARYKSLYGSKTARQLVEKAYTIELSDPIGYLQAQFPTRDVFRFILTHPDMDHLSGICRLDHDIGIVNIWDTDNNKTISDDSWAGSPYDKDDWDAYQRLRQSTANPKCIRPTRGDSHQYWNEDGIEIFSPSPDLIKLANEEDEFNHSSYVLRVSYAGRKVFLGGDASKEALDDVLKSVGKNGMKADILLAPHHGSRSCFNMGAVEAISPKLIIVSVAVGTDYAYDEYSRFGEVLSTKWYGNITVTITDAGEIKYQTQYQR
jgi:competence protein ComEC